MKCRNWYKKIKKKEEEDFKGTGGVRLYELPSLAQVYDVYLFL